LTERGQNAVKIVKIAITVFYLTFYSNYNYSSASGRDFNILSNLTNILVDTVPEPGQFPETLSKLCSELKGALDAMDVSKGRVLTDSLLKLIKENPSTGNQNLIKPYYYIGACYSIIGRPLGSLTFFRQVLELLKRFPDRDIEGRTLHFMGYSTYLMGDLLKSLQYFDRALTVKRSLYGPGSLELIPEYISLASANINVRDYVKAIENSRSGLEIAAAHHDSIPPNDLAMLYQSIGIALLSTADYKQANMNLMKALEVYNEHSLPKQNNYINVLDNAATSFYYLGQFEKCIEYYEKGISYAINDNSILSLSLFFNYSIVLADQKMSGKGVKILSAAVEKSRKIFSGNSIEYYLSLRNYAEYLRDNNLDIQKARELFLKCFVYARANPWNINFNNSISLGYSLTLMDCNEPEVALDSIQSLLFRDTMAEKPADIYSNPDFNKIKPDKPTWNILGAKYRILRKIYASNNDFKAIRSAANISELMIGVLEDIRLNIGEEESRLLLGDKYRDSYMHAIECFNTCYRVTGDPVYIEKAFVYTEKSKAANLLASTREMKAIKFHIPENLASIEESLQKEISFYNALFSEENNREKPDSQKIKLWRDYLITAIQKRDSMKKVFEKNYPEYHTLKYNTQVIKTKDIPGLIGRDRNYISYVISDTSLYILVVNRKYTQLTITRIDSTFFGTLLQFRKLLSDPDLEGDALNAFKRFQMNGHRLYSYLIEPVRKYLISDKIIISPDNTLALFPFETIITDGTIKDDLLYGNLPYLMNDYQISYTYSATLLSESETTRPSFTNRTISFAPTYKSVVYVDSLLTGRQSGQGVLQNLPYAIEEAAFVRQLTSGTLYKDDLATESAFKTVAGNYDVIHLAMHTVLNEKDPMNSGMIFSKGSDPQENPYLTTYEIYGIPLKAKMVVLSSCYTGTGVVSAGEGVLSLARGFIFAGGKSVIMSLWEVNDKSGTDIIKSFYLNLKSGKSKSNSLRKARLEFLSNADMLRSHPYFWSTLVIYGDDSPLYYKWSLKVLIGLIPLLIVLAVVIYFRKRRYS
jgi:CHAT domain-containing protein